MPLKPSAVLSTVLLLACALAASAPIGAQPAGSGGVNRPEHRDKPYVILVSLDGFKPEYLDRFTLPNFRRVAQRGTRAAGMFAVFPSLTFPNHYSLVTGLHPEGHGIVSNRFYDPELKDTYVYTDPAKVTDGKWYGGEPIWVTAEIQGMVAACYFWPGSEAPIKGVRPTIYKNYSGTVPNDERVDAVLEWLRMPAEKRPHLITLYFAELDSASHSNALDSQHIENAAVSLDRSLGRLLDGLDTLPIKDQVYLLLTSDHGMVDTSSAKTIQLGSLIGPGELADLVAGFSGPVANLHIRGGAERVRAIRDAINRTLKNGKAYLRAELPERYHYSGNPRAGDIVVVMDEAWTLSVPRPATEPRSPSLPAPTESRNQTARPEEWGAHGWDPALPSMRALFLGMGPTIRQGATVGEIRNIDVYPFIAEVLGLKLPTPLDGTPGRLKSAIGR